jgi:hypothetical protein
MTVPAAAGQAAMVAALREALGPAKKLVAARGGGSPSNLPVA